MPSDESRIGVVAAADRRADRDGNGLAAVEGLDRVLRAGGVRGQADGCSYKDTMKHVGFPRDPRQFIRVAGGRQATWRRSRAGRPAKAGFGAARDLAI